MAGAVPMTNENKRNPTARPSKEFDEGDLYPLHDKPDEDGAEEVDDKKDDQQQLADMVKKVEELETRLAEQFDDEWTPWTPTTNHKGSSESNPRGVGTTSNNTHTPFAARCRHCVAARDVRRNRPKQGRKGRLAPDTENGDGPTKVSLDYMYLHERIGKYRDLQHNPPYLVIIEHKIGRCWAYQVPSKGVNDEAYLVPKRVLQDIENSGLGDTSILLKIDQEFSIVCIQTVIQEFKPDIVPVNRPVGEFVCNGRVEDTI